MPRGKISLAASNSELNQPAVPARAELYQRQVSRRKFMVRRLLQLKGACAILALMMASGQQVAVLGS